MSRIFVSGLINLEVTLRVDGFPISYAPVRYPFHGVHSNVSGVGFNVAKALASLGDQVRFASMVGRDFAGSFARLALKRAGISTKYLVEQLPQTPHSVILFDTEGQRQINVDLKDIQESVYPEEVFVRASAGCSLLALCNINFSRRLLRNAYTAIQKAMIFAAHKIGVTCAAEGFLTEQEVNRIHAEAR